MMIAAKPILNALIILNYLIWFLFLSKISYIFENSQLKLQIKHTTKVTVSKSANRQLISENSVSTIWNMIVKIKL